jgi:outer membrane murein-binding lipoprotein Lpp
VTIFTVDVSNHDWDRHGGALDWGKIRGAGIQAMCAKATEGDPSGYAYTDPYFAPHCRGARAAGITLVGGYHVLSRGDQNSINRQVDWLRRRLGEIGGPGKGVWAMIDVEPFQELVSQGIAPRWDDVRRFADRWHSVTNGFPLAVYLPRWVWSGTLGSPNISSLRGPLVSSDYGNNAALPPAALYAARGGDSGPGWQPYGGKTPELWQFGSSAKITGASSATDVNAYRGTLVQLHTRLTGDEQEMALTPAQDTALSIAWEVADALRDGQDITEARKDPVWLVKQIKSLSTDVATLKTQLDQLATKDLVDEQAVAKDVIAALTPAAIADAVVTALPKELAAQVINELSQRLATAGTTPTTP